MAAVIAAHSVVTRDIPSYAKAFGAPAKWTAFRFEQSIIEDLLKIRWWEWPDHKVDEFLPLIMSTDVRTFVAAALAAQ